MQTSSFIVTLNHDQELDILLCTELPEFIHVVKYYPTLGVSLFFDAEIEWTAELEEAAFDKSALLLQSIVQEPDLA